jgi:tetratricopeptide (TPR) repeat protein
VAGGRIFHFSIWWANDLEKAVNEFRSGRYDRAYERTARLIADERGGGTDLQAPSPVLWYHGLAAAHLKDYEPAIRDFAILTGRAYAQEQDSTNGNAWVPLVTNDFRYVLATMLYLGGHAGQAVPTFRRVLEVDLAVYSAHVQLARIFEQAGLLDSALVERQLALAVNPEDPDVNVEYAVTLMRAGRLAEATEPLADAARLNPHDARVPYLQGLVADQQRHPEEAREAWRHFLAIAPSRFAAQREEISAKLAQTGP